MNADFANTNTGISVMNIDGWLGSAARASSMAQLLWIISPSDPHSYYTARSAVRRFAINRKDVHRYGRPDDQESGRQRR